MSTEENKRIVREVIECGFGQGDLTVVDQYHNTDSVDHQEALGTDFIKHLKDAIVNLRTAFPDLHFEIHDIVAEGELVAFRSTMTGTHLGDLQAGPMRQIPATGRKVSVPHMHFMTIVDGKTTDLWHLWNTPMMLQQLGIMPAERQVPAGQ